VSFDDRSEVEPARQRSAASGRLSEKRSWPVSGGGWFSAVVARVSTPLSYSWAPKTRRGKAAAISRR
jgi:hypothetical protein